jgi:SPP1 family predicted phage head-tail adaptor
LGNCDNVTLNKRVTIQNVARSEDGQGGYTETWPDGATVWARLVQKKAWEKFQAQQTQTPVIWAVTMRYRTDVTSSSRIKYGDRILNVKEIINRNEEKRFLDIKAIET